VVTRILDLDLDFFLRGVEHWRAAGSGRLDACDYPPWSNQDAVAFLRDRCKLVDPLPGFVVENHATCSISGAAPSTLAGSCGRCQ
jgi:hypothetical protein